MKSTPENKVKRLLVEVLNRHQVFHYPASAGAYSIAGIPDRIGCSKGRFFGCEAKRPGGKPTALQLKKKAEIEAAGGAWFLIDGEGSLKTLEEWLKGETP